MIFFLLILSFTLSLSLFILCGFVLSGQKQEIELLWNCIDNNRRRLTKLEEQSNVAYVELYDITKGIRQQVKEIQNEPQNNT